MRRILSFLTADALMLLAAVLMAGSVLGGGGEMDKKVIKLPAVKISRALGVEEAISKRRSRRRLKGTSLDQGKLSHLLWAGQGITNREGFRAAPSAGATFPLTIYVVIGNVEAIPAGLYRYQPDSHCLEALSKGDLRKDLSQAALGQAMIAEAPVSIVIAADYSRTTDRYGQRGRRYVDMEVGHAGQNIYLECEVLGLGTCAVGAFNDKTVKELLGIAEQPLYIMPIGVPD